MCVIIVMLFVRLYHNHISKLFYFFNIVSKSDLIVLHCRFIYQMALPIESAIHSRTCHSQISASQGSGLQNWELWSCGHPQLHQGLSSLPIFQQRLVFFSDSSEHLGQPCFYIRFIILVVEMVIGCRTQLDHSFLLNLSNQIIALLGITLEISDLRTFLSYLLVCLWFDDTVWMTYLAALLDSWFRIHIIDLIWLSIRIQTLHILRRGSVNCMQGFTASKFTCLHFLHWIILFLDIDVVRFVWICVQFMNVIVHLWTRTWIVLIFYLRTHDFFDVFCVRLFCDSNIFFFAYILLIF